MLSRIAGMNVVVCQSTTASPSWKAERSMNIPDTMADWPWQRAFHPYTDEATLESDKWFRSLAIFSPKSMHAHEQNFVGCLAGLAYPHGSPNDLRAGMDFMHVLFAIDEYAEIERPAAVAEFVQILLDAFHNPGKPRPSGEITIGELTRQFWARAGRTATPQAGKYFLEAMKDFLDSLVSQAEYRNNGTNPSIDDYIQLRKNTVGARPAYIIGHLCLSIPDEALYHPAIRELEYLAAELLALDNDLASYNREQATGNDQHNIVTTVMRHLKLDLDAAVDWTASYHKQVERRFLDTLERVPSFGPAVDADLKRYITQIANFPRANYCWIFESGRYFGSHGAEYQRTRRVPLLPKRVQQQGAITSTADIDVPLIEDLERLAAIAAVEGED
ncbi:terpenoid synthase [Dichomitus squalens]|uniref:Terpene synthase n=1 Tax=Dichomitus squalens TaxID=114155 RepID=A0A4Q9NT47_9APHY|nr:terpenoid synthase [Dichomitus squalens]TBU56106.1 terpenoid synthase [Dichomitus squalens]